MNLKGTGAKPDSRLMLEKSHWKNALFGTPQDHDDFAFGLVSGKVSSELSDAAAVEGFVQLADFANDTGGALAAEVFFQFPQAARDAVWRFVENYGARFREPLFDARLATFFLGEKALKHKAVAWQAAGDEGWNQGGGAGQGLHDDAGGYGGAHEQKARIADARGAGVADEGMVAFCSGNGLHDRIHLLVLVVHVKGAKRRLHVEELEELAGRSGILRVDHFGALQDLKGPKGNVAQVAQGSWYEDEFSHANQVPNVLLKAGKNQCEEALGKFGFLRPIVVGIDRIF